ncbi:MAG: ABC transporter substrate-binding protein [Enhydrobacter sp.]|nr:MAG: ABC transporter substrate-binding protein [Enhydrobacter sp.]
MKRRVFAAVIVLGTFFLGPLATANPLPTMQETPSLAEQVKSGALPPVAKRIPEQPSIVQHFPGGDGMGRVGGDLNILIGGPRDTRLMTIYANARLIVYDDKFKLHPDILESYDVKEGREFTLKLRAGHKWSDGHPFTTEDFRYFWEDVANNKELSPRGPPVELLVDGRPPKVEIIDERTVRYTWDKPNPYFIPSQARAAPLWLYRPAHYLKKFHIKYTPAEEIAKAARGGQSIKWVQIHRRVDVMYNNDNPDLPTLNAWVLTTAPPAQRFVFARNPYYYRIDEQGVQLPYLDRIIFTVVAPNLVPAKAGLGEADLQPRYLNMRDYTFLQKSSKTSGVLVRLWESGSGAQIALYPNLNAKDEVWRKVMRDARFRHALSLGIDRAELNEVVYIGLAKPSNNTIMDRSELFKPEYATKWANYDPKLANKLLDEMGLAKRNDQGIRRLPDGRPATIVVEHTSEETEDNDALALITDHWKKIGIQLLAKPQTRENFRLRVSSGDAIMTAYAGVTTAVPTVDTSPKEFAPTMQGGLQWPQWGMFVESNGTQGEKCDLPEACKLLDYLSEWERSADPAVRQKAWENILQTHADQTFSIGTVNGILQPIVVSPKLRNVPEKGYYAWDPGGYIGLYKPDTFWLKE